MMDYWLCALCSQLRGRCSGQPAACVGQEISLVEVLRPQAQTRPLLAFLHPHPDFHFYAAPWFTCLSFLSLLDRSATCPNYLSSPICFIGPVSPPAVVSQAIRPHCLRTQHCLRHTGRPRITLGGRLNACACILSLITLKSINSLLSLRRVFGDTRTEYL